MTRYLIKESRISTDQNDVFPAGTICNRYFGWNQLYNYPILIWMDADEIYQKLDLSPLFAFHHTSVITYGFLTEDNASLVVKELPNAFWGTNDPSWRITINTIKFEINLKD